MAWLSFFRRRNRSQTKQYHVILPDGTERNFELERNATGNDLVEVSLLSMSIPSAHHYMFSLTVPPSNDGENRKWLRLRKNLRKELKNSPSPVTMHIQLLLYPKTHYNIEHKIVQHLLYGQVCTDLKEGRIRCSNQVLAQLAGLIAQAELGDYSERMLRSDYMSQLSQLNPLNLSPRLESMAIEQHKQRRGLRIENCINEFLTIAETLNGYGHVLFDLHDGQNRPVTLACGPKGIELLMGNIQTMMFLWESITIINIRHRMLNFQTETSYTSGTYSFRCPSVKRCNHIGLLCVEMRNHYCNSEAVHPPSKLKRFLSTRLTSNSRRQRRSLHRKASTLSSISAPAKYQNHFSSPSHSQLPNHVSASQINATSNNSLSTPLLDLPLEQSQSPIVAEVTVLPPLEEKEPIHNEIRLVELAPRKTTSLPAKMDPKDVFTMGGDDSGYFTKELNGETHNKEIDNLDCINELLEEGLESVTNGDPYSYQTKLSRNQRRENGKVHLSDDSNPKMRRRSDRGVKYDRVRSDSHSLVPYRSSTMQHPKRAEKSLNSSRSSYHYHQTSDPSRHYHSASSLYRVSSSSNRFSEGVVTMAHQLSLATLSQDSAYVDPHIRSFVYDSSQADTETEL